MVKMEKNMEINGYTIGPDADLYMANLSRANLCRADLRGSNLSGSNLSGSNLIGVNFCGANLSGSNLSGSNLGLANLSGVNLCGANLSGSKLSESNLSWSNFSRANLCGANLSGSNLSWANLNGANLCGAYLSKTCLDPENKPNADCEFFDVDATGLIVGFRTRFTPYIHAYRDGQTYGADFFSTCETECHPGLFLWPTLEMAKNWSCNSEIIKVVTEPKDVHKAGTKWRTRWFRVIGTA